MSYTGECANCGEPFGKCVCSWELLKEECARRIDGEKFPLKDLIHTLLQHCKIADKLLKDNDLDLVPSVIEDIYYFAQYLPEHFIEEG